MAGVTVLAPRGAIALIWTLITILYFVLFVRYLVLRRLRGSRAWNKSFADWTVGLGICTLTLQVTLMTWTSARLDYYQKHPSPAIIPQFGMPLADAIKQQKITMVAVFAYYTTIWSVKFTFLLCYFEMHQHLKKFLSIFLNVLTILIGVTYCINMIMNGAWCIPISRAWTFTEVYCSPTTSMALIAFGAWSNVATDMLLMLFPLLLLKTLQINRRQIWAVGILMIIGVLTITSAIVRFVVMTRLKKTENPADILRWWQETQILSGVEQWIGLIAACLPALRALLNKSWKPKDVSYNADSLTARKKKKGSGKYSTDSELLEVTKFGSQAELSRP